MKTTQIMKREFLGKEVSQNHKDGFFCINDITRIANVYRTNQGLPKAKWIKYKDSKKTKEFFSSLMKQENLAEIIRTNKGTKGKTWAHPLVFFDYAMWLSPDFKVKVYKWLYDNLTVFRDESGESYKEMSSILFRTQKNSRMNNTLLIQNLAKAIKRDLKCDNWNKAGENTLRIRNHIHSDIILLLEAKIPPITAYRIVQKKYKIGEN